MEEYAAGKTPSFTPTNKNQENKDKRKGFLFTFDESQGSHREDESEPVIVSHDFNEDES